MAGHFLLAILNRCLVMHNANQVIFILILVENKTEARPIHPFEFWIEPGKITFGKITDRIDLFEIICRVAMPDSYI